MGSRTSAETLNPLPPHPARHQLSAIPPTTASTRYPCPMASGKPLIGSSGPSGISAANRRSGGSPSSAACPNPLLPRHVWMPPPVQEESLNRCCAGCVDAPSGARRIFEQVLRGIGCCHVSGLCCGGSQAAGPYGSSWIRSTSLERARSAVLAPGSPDPVSLERARSAVLAPG